jgi:hypothetical protein
LMLLPDERRLLTSCHDHPVATCSRCSEAVTFEQMGVDLIIGRRDFCPMCRADLTIVLRKHLAECPLKRAQERELRERVRQSRKKAGTSPSAG